MDGILIHIVHKFPIFYEEKLMSCLRFMLAENKSSNFNFLYLCRFGLHQSIYIHIKLVVQIINYTLENNYLRVFNIQKILHVTFMFLLRPYKGYIIVEWIIYTLTTFYIYSAVQIAQVHVSPTHLSDVYTYDEPQSMQAQIHVSPSVFRCVYPYICIH